MAESDSTLEGYFGIYEPNHKKSFNRNRKGVLIELKRYKGRYPTRGSDFDLRPTKRRNDILDSNGETIWGKPDPFRYFLQHPFVHFAEAGRIERSILFHSLARFFQYVDSVSEPWELRATYKWLSMSPAEREPYIQLANSHRAEFIAATSAFNAKVPLSPLVEILSELPNPINCRLAANVIKNAYAGVSDICSERLKHWQERRTDIQRQWQRRGAQLWNRMRRDYSSPPPTPNDKTTFTQSFNFFALPTEIRALILQFALTNQKKVKHMPANRTTNSDSLLPVMSVPASRDAPTV